MLQTYQAMCLAEFDTWVTPDSSVTPLMMEVMISIDYILQMSHGAVLSLGRGLASTMVVHRHLWLTLSDIPPSSGAECRGVPAARRHCCPSRYSCRLGSWQFTPLEELLPWVTGCSSLTSGSVAALQGVLY